MSPQLEDDFPSPGRTTTSPRTSTGTADTRPSLSSDLPAPPWAPHRPIPSGARRLSSHHRRSRSSILHLDPTTTAKPTTSISSFLTDLQSTLTAVAQQSLRLYLTLPPWQRILLLVAGAGAFALGVLFLVYSHRIFAALGPLAATWRAHGPAAWVLVWLATCATAFPPVIGYSTCVTVAGFVYGFPAGWPLAASATVAGSTAAFLSSRGIFAGYVQRLVGKDRRFVALGQVLRRDGIGVLVMIRLCPLPYSLSNGFLATVGSIRPGVFALATAGATPKLLVHVFIGSRLALLAESGDKMSGWDRAINYISMAVFGLIGFGVGLLIYRRTMARAAELAREDELEAGDALLDGTPGEDDEGMEEGVLGDDLENGRMVDPDELDAAALMDDDDISLWDTGSAAYHDSWDDDDAAGGMSNKGGLSNGHEQGNINSAKK
ncbi:hypothetical protein C8A03DRAFT_32093 [Achaetomium macrosporum]|uniref:Golgi apparatus membrane protein TVP38 n=1 Tax=Achaetomium macrosporum TaxID=79813 RepID=A0AAN7CEG3_9PEZI|nr:hypothetical protein C8A03DRAFT_32093 [Achaetomium macrosporum]